MSEILQSLILGIIQGIGEFLPISSTAHLILAPYFFGWKDPGLVFDVALHIGTLIAVVAYFWKDWIYILKIFFQNKLFNIQYSIFNSSEDLKNKYPSNILWLLIFATVPGALAGYFLENYAENYLRNPLIIAFFLFFVGLILYLVDKYRKHQKTIGEINFKDALIIGFSQAVAVIPGVSRSGSTIIAGLLRGVDREGAARFSFLLSTPIIFGAAIAKLPNILDGNFNSVVLFVGVLSSAVSGYFAISFLLKFIQRVSYALFFWYRLILAVVIVIFYIFH